MKPAWHVHQHCQFCAEPLRAVVIDDAEIPELQVEIHCAAHNRMVVPQPRPEQVW